MGDIIAFRDALFDAFDSLIVDQPCLEYALNLPYTTSMPLIMEFGVYTGSSLQRICKLQPNAYVFGFECFKGLPEDWRPGYGKGVFAIPDVFDMNNIPDGVLLAKGYFEQTAPSIKALIGDRKIDMIHIDCDIYSSTKCIFDTFKENIRDGTIIVFDELFNYPGYIDHELKALFEFQQQNPLKQIIPVMVQNSPRAFDKVGETWGQQAVVRIV